MPFTVTMPKLSPTMAEGTVARWLKKEGEFVEAGALLLEIATDKATVEHAALDEGWLRKILVPEGGSALLNQPIAIFTESANESIEGYAPPVEIKKEEKSSEAKTVEAAQETLTPQMPSGPGLAEPAFAPSAPLEDYAFEFPGERIEKPIASPLAKRLAKEQGLNLASVKGSGPGGRITSHDLEKAQAVGLVSFGERALPTTAPGTYEEIPLSPLRKIISKRLQESKTFVPHFYVKQVIDAEGLVHVKDQLKNLGVKVTFNDLIIRAAALALRQHPGVNAGFFAEHQTIIQFKTIDISIAVSVEGGLITPIIRHADYKNVGELGVEMRALAEKARQKKLTEQEYKGGSFCISNLGMYGITEFSAVINPPQAAILAVGGIQETPVVKSGEVRVGKTLALTLSVDHRVIDGALAAQFLKTVQALLENPAALLI